MLKRRIAAAVLALILIPLGLWLRFRMPGFEWPRDASGGIAYVVFWMLAAAVLWPCVRPARMALIVFLATCAIEFSQAWHPSWLDALRHTLPGRLVLGTTFNWGDFPPYALGACLGWGLLQWLQYQFPQPKSTSQLVP